MVLSFQPDDGVRGIFPPYLYENVEDLTCPKCREAANLSKLEEVT